ncbi:MAG: hypothetical protein QOE66_2671 [Chloroflexota bacterium]|nr:hypothetical protein [Chloroflexota bacterium]
MALFGVSLGRAGRSGTRPRESSSVVTETGHEPVGTVPAGRGIFRRLVAAGTATGRDLYNLTSRVFSGVPIGLPRNLSS